MTTALATVCADLRARASWLPPCPLCSHVDVDGFPLTIVSPMAMKSRRNGAHGLLRCCALSDGCPWLDSAADVAAWWRERRITPLGNIALDNRRVHCLAKLAAHGLEPP